MKLFGKRDKYAPNGERQYTFKEKVKYYKNRVKNKSLTENQRLYASSWLEESCPKKESVFSRLFKRKNKAQNVHLKNDEKNNNQKKLSVKYDNGYDDLYNELLEDNYDDDSFYIDEDFDDDNYIFDEDFDDYLDEW